jgi:nucleoid-associated protein YgaU
MAVTASMLFTALSFVSPSTLHAAEVEHRLRADDNLHLLAAYYYGDPRRWKEIYQANPGIAGSPNLLPGGSVIVIPARDLRPSPLPYEEWKSAVSR